MKPTTSTILGFVTRLLEERVKPLTISLLVASFLLLGLPNSPFAQQARQTPPGQAAQRRAPLRLRDIRRISVEEFGRSDMARKIQERVILGIIQSGRLQVVSASASPDATLRGSVSSTREVQVTVLLLARGNQELWSRLVQPAASNGANQAEAAASVAGRIVKHLLKAIEEDRNAA
jgi:hypothetical protein